MKVMELLVCQRCGKEFTPKDSKPYKYCGVKCANSSRSVFGEKKLCKHCGLIKHHSFFQLKIGKKRADGSRGKSQLSSICKKCGSDLRKKHYTDNKKYYKDKNKKWFSENREKQLVYSKKEATKRKELLTDSYIISQLRNRNKNIKWEELKQMKELIEIKRLIIKTTRLCKT